MKGHRKNRSSKSGLPPGTPVHIGEQKLETMSLTALTYSEQALQEIQTDRVEEGLAAGNQFRQHMDQGSGHPSHRMTSTTLCGIWTSSFGGGGYRQYRPASKD